MGELRLAAETWKAFVLGVVEGLTEFIPVSSTGHLILFGDAIEFHGELASTFEIFIQLGAILAVVYLYFSRFLSLLPTTQNNSKGGLAGFSGCIKLAVACLPAFVLGPLVHSSIKAYLFFPAPVAIALIAGGVVLIAVDRGDRNPSVLDVDSLSLKQCFGIGVCQCAALWPGVSRSGATIIGGMLLGLERKVAAEFSFLLAVPVMFAAVIYDLYKSRAAFESDDLLVFAIGFIVSFVTAIIAIRFFLKLLGSHTMQPFGYYRVVLGAVVLGLLFL